MMERAVMMKMYNKTKCEVYGHQTMLCALLLIILITNITDNEWGLFTSVTAQSSEEIHASIVRDATNLDDQAYFPNPISVTVGETVLWTNDDSTRHTVTEQITGDSNNPTTNEPENDKELFERILEEIIANISYNLKNVIGNKEDSLLNTSENDPESLPPNRSGTSNPILKFDSEILEEGDTYEYTFNKPGIFEYYCTIHPDMAGKVEVVDYNN